MTDPKPDPDRYVKVAYAVVATGLVIAIAVLAYLHDDLWGMGLDIVLLALLIAWMVWDVARDFL